MKRFLLALPLVGALALSACTGAQIQQASLDVQMACADYAAVRDQVGAQTDVSKVTVYGDPICQSATTIAKFSGDPSTAAYIGGLTQQVKALVGGKPAAAPAS